MSKTTSTSSNLSKACIYVLNSKGAKADEIKVLFNPGEYSLEKSNKYQESAIPGLSSQVLQFVSGNARTLTMDLFFDTSLDGEDVRDYVNRLDALVDINSEMHAPPVCQFFWKDISFKSIVERLNKKFTMFKSDGTPIRATVGITFKEYAPISDQVNNPPRHSADRTKRRIVREGDSLWHIASNEYGDPHAWRRIAKANGITNPLNLSPGIELIIPPLE